MTSGVKTRFEPPRRAWLAAAALLLSGALPALAAAATFDLAALMGVLARQPAGEARFTEQRFVAGLDAPLASSGTLSFTAPDRLVRRTLAPRAEAFAVDGNTLTLTRGGRSRNVALDSLPELLPMIEALRGTLSGDAPALQRHFRTVVDGSADAWTLDLTPLDARLAAQVSSLRIAGSQADLRSVDIRFAGGDRSRMAIEPLAAASGEAPQAESAPAAPRRPAAMPTGSPRMARPAASPP